MHPAQRVLLSGSSALTSIAAIALPLSIGAAFAFAGAAQTAHAPAAGSRAYGWQASQPPSHSAQTNQLPSESAQASGRHAQRVKLQVAFQPDRPGARTTIRFGFQISGPNHTPPSPIVSLSLRMPEHMGLLTTTLGQASCYPGPLLRLGLAGCSENARLGFGDAVAVVPLRNDPVYERASLTALLGPPTIDHIQVLFYAEGLTPVFAQFVFPGVLVDDVHPFGDRINTTIPLVAPWPNGPNIALTSFSSTIGPLHLTYHRQVNGKRVAYQPHGLTIPRHCPRGGYPFAAVLAFEDGSTTQAIVRVPCHRS
jgi:hypothetical protein